MTGEVDNQISMREMGESKNALAREIADTIIARWTKEGHHKSPSPFILFLGGLQGSGKTSTIAQLRKDSGLDFAIISPDEIRWEMFSREVFLTEETSAAWAQTVDTARNMLLKAVLQRNFSVVID